MAQYNELKRNIEHLIRNGKLPTIDIANSLNVEYNALTSLYNQFQVRSIKRDIKKFDSKSMHRIIERVHTNEVISAIAKEYGFSAYKLASMYLDLLFGKSISIRNLADNPNLIHQYYTNTTTNNDNDNINTKYHIHTDRIDIITHDILNVCYAQDSSSSWESEVCKQCIGMYVCVCMIIFI